MGPLDAIKTCLARSFQFKGRASRAEFWWFTAIFSGVGFISFWAAELFLPARIGSVQNTAFTAMIVSLTLLFLPLVSAGVRRFHDLGLGGVLFLAPLIILAIGMGVGLYDKQIANPLQQYAGLNGALIGYGGFLMTAPFILLTCTLKSRNTNHTSNEVPQ